LKPETYKFIDLFAGIGGFHIGMENNGMQCVFASEIDKEARKTYQANHQIHPDQFNQDINDIDPHDIPDHDILCAGFPCQPFSQAGFKKGLSDDRGNLFFNILAILEAKRPKAFILENVRHLFKHDNGATFNIIYSSLMKNDYYTEYQVIKGSDFGLPQLRPRLFLVGFDNKQVDTSKQFLFPKPIPLQKNIQGRLGLPCELEEKVPVWMIEGIGMAILLMEKK
jgi:DNA (cytosine-5)-methyltransferase 1